jgi:hypothetical protein
VTQQQDAETVKLLCKTHQKNQDMVRIVLGVLISWFAVGVFLLLRASLESQNVAGLVTGGIVTGLVAIPAAKLLVFVKQNQVLNMLPGLLLMVDKDARSGLIRRAIDTLLDGGKKND